MSLPSQLEQDLLQTLRAFGALHAPAVVPAAPGRALEAWLLLRLARAAHRSGLWSVSLRRGDDTRLHPGHEFVLPSHQSGIKPPDPLGRCHVLLVKKADPSVRFEIHGSLQWVGRSGATHECDISVLPFSIADELRRTGGGRPRGLPIAAYECKDRLGRGSLDEMRQKLARLFDMVLVTKPGGALACRIFSLSGPVSWGQWRSTYRSFFRSGCFGIVRSGAFSSGAADLARHYHIAAFSNIYSNSATIRDIEKKFLKALAVAS